MTRSLTLDDVHYLAVVDSKCEFSLEEVRQLAEEVLEYRRVRVKMLKLAEELRVEGAIGYFISKNILNGLRP